METIELRNLCAGYQAHGKVHATARSLNASLTEGTLTCLIGANGTGKSTLLRTLAGLQPALGGEVLLAGKTLGDYTANTLAQTVSIVLTGKLDTGNLSVEDLVALGRSPYTDFFGTLTRRDRMLIDEAMSLSNINSLRHRRLSTLSDGERQKTFIAKSLAQQTPILLLDEPTAFLDFPTKVALLQMLHRLAHDNRKTVLLSTHDIELALQLSNRLWLLTPQGALHAGTPGQLAQQGLLGTWIDGENVRLNPFTLRIELAQKHTPAASSFYAEP